MFIIFNYIFLFYIVYSDVLVFLIKEKRKKEAIFVA